MNLAEVIQFNAKTELYELNIEVNHSDPIECSIEVNGNQKI
jgi:hypothetical protein